MDKSNVKEIEHLIEVVLRSIPKERQAHDIYQATAEKSKSEMTRLLFEKLAEQEEQHEAKLHGALEFLKEEISEAKGRAAEISDSTRMHDEALSDREKIEDIERVMEVVMRMIPKEREARQLYLSTAREAGREMLSQMFNFMAEQETQHESKLQGILQLLKMELVKIKGKKG